MRADRGAALREIGTLFSAGTFVGLGDGALLDRFVSAHGEAAEAAFAVIVDRHGPMVLRVCRRALNDRNDAEDAFQATFIALLRGARSIRNRDSVASWLHGTALRVSAVARSSRLRRKAHEERSAAQRPGELADPGLDDLRAAIVEEVGRLPDRYRMAIVLCDLEGLSHRDAAESLGWPVGTIKSRVTRGRERLKSRLIRRGLAPAVGLIGVVSREAAAIVRPSLAEATVALAMGQRSAGVLSVALTLASLYQRSLIMNRIKTLIVVAAFGVLATGTGLLAQGRGGAGPGAGVAAAGDAETLVKAYQVADLLISDRPQTVGQARPSVDMSALIDIITSTVAPGTWEILDKNGQRARADLNDGAPKRSIIPFYLSLSLIVRQTPEVHVQVAERLEMLRRLVRARDANGDGKRRGETTPASVPTSVDDKSKRPWFMEDLPDVAKETREGKEKAAALRLLYEGRQAYKAGDFEHTEKSIQAGLRAWSRFVREYPRAKVDDDLTTDALMRTVGQYLHAVRQLGRPIPRDLPFLDLIYKVDSSYPVPVGPRGAVAPPPAGVPAMIGSEPPLTPAPDDGGGMMLPSEAPVADIAKALEQGRVARNLLYEGTTAYEAGNFDQAVQSYEKGLPLWTDLIKTYPNYSTFKFNASEIERIIIRLADARRRLGLQTEEKRAAKSSESMPSMMMRGATPPRPAGGGMASMMMGGAPAPAPKADSRPPFAEEMAVLPLSDPKAEWLKALSTVIDTNRADWANTMQYRSKVEQIKAEQQGATARKFFEEGTIAYEAAHFAEAVQNYEVGLQLWADLLQGHPNYRADKYDAGEIERISKRLTRARRQLGLPDPNTPTDGSGMAGMMSSMMGAAGGLAPAPGSPPAVGPGGMSMGMGMMGSGGAPAATPGSPPAGSPGMMKGMPGMPGMAEMMSPGGAPVGMGGPPGMMGSKVGSPGQKGKDARASSGRGKTSSSAGGSASAPVAPPAAGSGGMMSSSMSGMAAMTSGGAPPAGPGGMMASQPPAPGTETERRLRAVEVKLDRLLKLMDKSEASNGKGEGRQ